MITGTRVPKAGKFPTGTGTLYLYIHIHAQFVTCRCRLASLAVPGTGTERTGTGTTRQSKNPVNRPQLYLLIANGDFNSKTAICLQGIMLCSASIFNVKYLVCCRCIYNIQTQSAVNQHGL